MVMSPYPDAAGVATAGPPAPEIQPAAGPPATPEPETYLIAFKDRTIYSAVAFWVDGDTLHYFTSGNMHNQASLSLVDKELTQRLNKELGIDLRLP
jgi:endonuclease YncB( thermonuclease family)